ncbi:MAG: type I secretion system permease/ATPase [Nevskiaceae bacterium]|jgi:ATP-binding cassette subfamily C protein LapB|nr:type I secretion system permease/ATPase [Nevskiaceae bacterium]
MDQENPNAMMDQDAQAPQPEPTAARQSVGLSQTSPSMTHWVEAILLVAKRLGVAASPEALRRAAAWSPDIEREAEILALSRAAGLEGTFTTTQPAAVPKALWPFLVEVDGGIMLVTAIAEDGTMTGEMSIAGAVSRARIIPHDDQGGPSGGNVPHRLLLLQPAASQVDERVRDYAPAPGRDWLRELFSRNKKLVLELGAGSLVGNMLGIATALFSMQVWDRVVPARSINTLWVLALGVGFALLLEYGLRVTRASITDHFGKKADLELSDFFYSRLLDIRNDARPRSPGSLIAQMRDFEQVRELLTSTAFGVLLDIPFVFAFIGVIGLIGGNLALVPLIAAPLVVVPGLIAQYPLAKLSTEGMAESALRNAILMESVYRVEDIKSLQAEPRFRGLWHKANQRSSEISLRQRHLAAMLMSFSGTAQNLAYTGVIIAGVYGVLQSGLSTGTVIACSILTSRTLAPLAQIPAALSRLQNAKVAKEGLDRLLTLPVDHDPHKDRYHKPALAGGYRFDKVQYAYGPEEGLAMDVASLSIKPGERIAVLGRTGAGKSTLLRLLAGMAQPQQGRILLDGTPLDLIDVADVRRSVGCLLQDSSLFLGTLRENLLIAAPLADDPTIQRAMKIACADRLLLNQPHGLDLKLRESGVGLSGGQKQALMLARLILREPHVVLLDEPTASLDEATEREVIANLGLWLGQRTMVVATHRYQILSIVQRVIVVDGGRIVLDAPRDEALRKLSGNSAPAGGSSAGGKPPVTAQRGVHG